MSLRQRLAELVPSLAVRTFARPYVAGDSLDAALATADELWRTRRLASTLDVLGEHVTSEAAAAQALGIYERAASAVASRSYCSLSIKPGHFGHYVDPALCRAQVRRLGQRCQQQGTRLTVDMEDVDLTDATLALYRDLRPELPVLGTVLQAKLHRTPADLESLRDLGARVRLCLGVYDVAPEHGTASKRVAKERLLELLPRALEICELVELATHDERVVREAVALARRLGVAAERLEHQMLLGVPRRRLQDELVAAGAAVRLYVPFAESWDEATAYLRRRLAESPSMALLVLRNVVGGGG